MTSTTDASPSIAAINTRPYRVVQWATGNIGTKSLRGVIEHPALTLSGVYVHSPEKAGVDAGDLCGPARPEWSPPTVSTRSWPSPRTASSTWPPSWTLTRCVAFSLPGSTW